MSRAAARALAAIIAVPVAVTLAAGCSSDGGGDAGPDDAPPPAERVAVPDVAGLTPAAAVELICDAGLTVGAVEVVARTPEVRGRAGRAGARMRVRSTTPAAGVALPAGHFVDLGVAVPRNAAIVVRAACDPAAAPAPGDQEGGRTSRQ
ncbi:PASTA domain-containing protein [Miltoncostaea marina]|uniref:PASTA domain-containing protein n=1 Tax=Miltoncostaea marina TaxID=2843215 RepID=UPI001C3C9244|nr:hypothetical protein [Miltoncostaea marina]